MELARGAKTSAERGAASLEEDEDYQEGSRNKGDGLKKCT